MARNPNVTIHPWIIMCSKEVSKGDNTIPKGQFDRRLCINVYLRKYPFGALFGALSGSIPEQVWNALVPILGTY